MSAPASVKHLSHSSLALLKQCGRAWEFRYVERIKSPPTPTLLFGRAIHAAIETLMGAWALNEDADLMSAWRLAWTVAAATEGVSWGKDDPAVLFERGRAMLRHPGTLAALREATPGLDATGQPLIEVPVQLRVEGVGVPLIGFADAITPAGVVIDLKTATKAWKEEEAHEPFGTKGIQATLYLSGLLQSGYRLPGCRFRFIVLSKGKRASVQVIETTRSARNLMGETAAFMRLAWGDIERGEFRANVFSELCRPGRCGYWSVCPDGGGKR